MGKRANETRLITVRRPYARRSEYKSMIWEGHHYRFGFAGEGQADMIQGVMDQHRGAALNVGCGPLAAKLQALATHCRSLTAVDCQTEGLRLAKVGVSSTSIHLVVGDVHRLPFCSSTFDYVLALGLFAHISDPEPAFRETRRVCRMGAHVFVTNAVRHSRTRYEDAALRAGFDCVHAEEGYCPAASGDVKRRYLLVLRPSKRAASS
jgi:SAM-dependent methyltransferase